MPNLTDVKGILLDIAGFLTYIAFAIALWQVDPDPLIIIIYMLIVPYVPLTFYCLLLRQELAHLQENLSMTEENFDPSEEFSDDFVEEPSQVERSFEATLSIRLHIVEQLSSDTEGYSTSIQEEHMIYRRKEESFSSKL